MTTNTKQTSVINTSTLEAPPVTSSAPAATPPPVHSAGKPEIKMSTAYHMLEALQLLAKTSRDMLDSYKDSRIEQIQILQDFTQEMWEDAYKAAEDGKKALFMQAGTSFAGAGTAIGGAITNGLTSGTQKELEATAAANKDFLKDLKTKVNAGDLTFSVENGRQVAGPNTVINELSPGAQNAITLLKDGRFAELRAGLDSNPPTITARNLTDAAKAIRGNAVEGASSASLNKSIDDRIAKWTNEENTATNKITQQQSLNKSLWDLAQGGAQGGLGIEQGKRQEASRQKEADVSKEGQAQKLTDSVQTSFGDSSKQIMQNLSAVTDQMGRIITSQRA